MGLDVVAIIMRTEEIFSVELPDEECGNIRTVGDLYQLVLSKLGLPYTPSREIEAQAAGRDRTRQKPSTTELWTPPDVWVTLKRIISDQLQIEVSEIAEHVQFTEDLGVD